MIKHMIPGREDCLRLLQELRVPEHIIQHCRVVRAVALFLGEALISKGEDLDRRKIEAGSLLHDISKMAGLERGESHAHTGALLLMRLGFAEIADIVRQHVILDEGSHLGPVTEAAVVHYADKRVRHTTVVSLKDRFQDLKVRYGRSPGSLGWLEALERQSEILEERLFQEMGVKPESLRSLLLDG